jgi:hypothetical protein
MMRSPKSTGTSLDRVVALVCYVGAAGTLGGIAFLLMADGLQDVAELSLLSGETFLFVGLARLSWRSG